MINLVNTINEYLENEPLVETVTYGSIDKVITNKQPLYPIAHWVVNQVTTQAKALEINFSLILFDILDVNKEDVENNKLYIQNTMVTVSSRLANILRSGDLRAEGFELQGDVVNELFTERFEDSVAGVTATYVVRVPNNVTIC